jgi:tetratricopeptide (TPR) repeat protein
LVRFSGEAARSIAADLAFLFEVGKDHSSAMRYFLQAARNAARGFAYREAAVLCERGLRALANLPASRERDAQELQVTLMLGMSLMVTRGYADPEVEKIYRRRDLCLILNDMRRLPSALWSLHTCRVNAGELRRALEVAREMREVADRSGDAIAIVESLHALGTTLAFMGRLVEAREALESVFKIYPVGQHVLHSSLYVMDPCVTSLSMLARLLTFMGDLDEAFAKGAESIELANRLPHPPSLVYAVFWMGWLHEMLGEHSEGIRRLESVMNLSRENGMPLFLEWVRVVRGSALTHVGRAAEGIAEIRKSLERQQAMGAFVERGYCLTLLAEALGGEGARQEALALCDEALEFGKRTEGRCEAETHRVRGEVLLALGDDARLAEVENEFRNALELARQAESRLIELCAAMSYFRLWRRIGDMAKGRTVLSEVLSRFSERLDAPAVRDAQGTERSVAAAFFRARL